ncbi:hypothetical protein FACS18942_10330 [Planctomycetales bacterium]|nr:hypothetical protein FACS18942_10330 [Planctomycetales bacterium]
MKFYNWLNEIIRDDPFGAFLCLPLLPFFFIFVAFVSVIVVGLLDSLISSISLFITIPLLAAITIFSIWAACDSIELRLKNNKK